MTDLHLWHLQQVDRDLHLASDSAMRATMSIALGMYHPTKAGHLKCEDALVALQRAQIEIKEARERTAEAIAQIEAVLAEPVLEAAE